MPDDYIAKSSASFIHKKELAFFDFYIGIFKRNVLWFLLLPVLMAVIAYAAIVSVVPELHTYSVILSMVNNEDANSMRMQQPHNTIVPNLELPEMRLSITTNDVEDFIKKSFPVRQKDFQDTAPFVSQVNTSKKGNMIYLTVQGGVNEKGDQFVNEILKAVNKNLSPLTAETMKDLDTRLKFLDATIESLEADLKRIETALSTYGFSAVLIQERSVLTPRLSYMKGLQLNYASKIESLKRGVVQKKSLVQKSKNGVVPNLNLYVISSFLFGLVLALLVTMFLEIPNFLKLSKSFLMTQLSAEAEDNVKHKAPKKNTFDDELKSDLEKIESKDDEPESDLLEKLMEKTHELAHRMDEAVLQELIYNWLGAGAKGYYKIALLTVSWYSKSTTKTLQLPQIEALADVFMNLTGLDYNLKVLYLEEVGNEISGILSLGSKPFHKLFSTFARVTNEQFKDLLDKLSEDEQAMLLLAIESDRRQKILSVLDAESQKKFRKKLIMGPDLIPFSTLNSIEEKSKAAISTLNNSSAQASGEARSTLDVKTQIMEEMDFMDSFRFVREMIADDYSSLKWFMENYFSFALVPYFKKDKLREISMDLPPDELMNVFALLGPEFLNEVIELQSAARKKILSDNAKRFDFNKIKVEVAQKWVADFKSKNVKNMKLDVESFYEIKSEEVSELRAA